MKIAVFYHHIREAAKQAGMTEEQVLVQLRKAGVGYAEADFDDLVKNPEMIVRLNEAGLSVSSIYCFFDFALRKEEDRVWQLIKTAHQARCRQVMVIPGFYYSEEKEGWAFNAGYMMEQMALYMAAKGIGSCYMGGAKVLAKEGSEYGSTSDKAVYNGPYKVANWTGGSDDNWSYVKNNQYYGKKNVHMNKVNVQVTKDNNTAQNLFKSGKVQETSVTSDYVKGNKNNKELHTSLMATQYYLYFNGKNDLTKNENFRQAVNYAFDNNQLAKKVLQDGSVGATGWVPKGDMKNPKNGQDFAEEAGHLQKQNKKKAQDYWKATQKDLGKKNMTLNLLADNTDDQKQVAEYLQSTLQKQFKGLKVEVTTLPHAQHVSRDFAGKFELNLTDWNSDVPDASDFLSLLKTGNKVNFTNNTDQKLDDLLNQANDGTKSASERYKLLQEANKQVHTNADGVPLYTAAQAHLVSKHVTGLNYGPFNTVAQYQYAQWKK